MRVGRLGRTFVCVASLGAALAACETARNIGGVQRDLTPPVILLSNTVGDTQDIAKGLQFKIDASDNLSLKTIRVTFSGGYIAGPFDTTFITQTTTKTIRVTFSGGYIAGPF